MIHTAYGPGEVVAQETVRGRTQYQVAGNGFKVWLDEVEVDKRTASDHEGASFDFEPSGHVNEGNSTTLPYSWEPQNPVDMFRHEQTISPDHQVDLKKRMKPSDSRTGEPREPVHEYPGPNPDLFAEREGRLAWTLNDEEPGDEEERWHQYNTHAVDPAELGRPHHHGVNTHGMDPEEHAYHEESYGGPHDRGGEWLGDEDGYRRPVRDWDPNTGYQPDAHDEAAAEAVHGDDDSGYNWGPAPHDFHERPAGLSDKYIDIHEAADHFNDPIIRFRDDPVREIHRHGSIDLSAGLDQETGDWMNLVEADKQVRTAAWKDVVSKAKRLRHEGRVQVQDMDRNRIYANVKGDNGEYDVMILKGGAYGGLGGGQAITSWRCSCPWGVHAFQRRLTYVGRLCSHGYATYLTQQAHYLKDNPHHFKKKGARHTSGVDAFKTWIKEENGDHIDMDAADNYLSTLDEPASKEDAQAIVDYVCTHHSERPERNYDVKGYTYDPDKVYKNADVLRHQPGKLTPHLYVVPEGEEEGFTDLGDDRKTTGPDQIMALRQIGAGVDRFRTAVGVAAKAAEDFERHLAKGDGFEHHPAFAWHAEDEPDFPEQGIVHFSSLTFTADDDLLSKLRNLSEDAYEPGDMQDRNREISEAVKELRDRGYDADQLVAFVRRAMRKQGVGAGGGNTNYQEPGASSGGGSDDGPDQHGSRGALPGQLGVTPNTPQGFGPGSVSRPGDSVPGSAPSGPTNNTPHSLNDAINSDPQSPLSAGGGSAPAIPGRGGGSGAPIAPINTPTHGNGGVFTPNAPGAGMPAPGAFTDPEGVLTHGPAGPAGAGGGTTAPKNNTSAPAGAGGGGGDIGPIGAGDYTVKPGDTLSGIAQGMGAKGGYGDLVSANPGNIGNQGTNIQNNADLIHPGDVLHNPVGGGGGSTPAPNGTADSLPAAPHAGTGAPPGPAAPAAPAPSAPSAPGAYNPTGPNAVPGGQAGAISRVFGGGGNAGPPGGPIPTPTAGIAAPLPGTPTPHVGAQRFAERYFFADNDYNGDSADTSANNNPDDKKTHQLGPNPDTHSWPNQGPNYPQISGPGSPAGSPGQQPMNTPRPTTNAQGQPFPTAPLHTPQNNAPNPDATENAAAVPGPGGASSNRSLTTGPAPGSPQQKSNESAGGGAGGTGGGQENAMNIAGPLISGIGGMIPGVGGLVSGLAGGLGGLTHMFGAQHFAERYMQGAGDFLSEGGPDWADYPFAGSGPDRQEWSTTSEDYVNEHERPKRQETWRTDNDGDIVKYSKPPKQARRVRADMLSGDAGYGGGPGSEVGGGTVTAPSGDGGFGSAALPSSGAPTMGTLTNTANLSESARRFWADAVDKSDQGYFNPKNRPYQEYDKGEHGVNDDDGSDDSDADDSNQGGGKKNKGPQIPGMPKISGVPGAAAESGELAELAPLALAASRDDGSDIVRQFHASGGGCLGNDSGSGGGQYGDDAIAAQAQKFLQRTAGRNYTMAEQRALEDEQHFEGARNLKDLDLRGTHYVD